MFIALFIGNCCTSSQISQEFRKNKLPLKMGHGRFIDFWMAYYSLYVAIEEGAPQISGCICMEDCIGSIEVCVCGGLKVGVFELAFGWIDGLYLCVT